MNVAIDIEDALVEQELPSKTYNIDWKNKRITGHCDEVEALKQAIRKALLTKRDEFPLIYSEDYGSEIENAMYDGCPTNSYLETVIPTLIEECLLEDDRITAVTDVNVYFEGNVINVSLKVNSDFGEFDMQEVI